jgi:hypothetical protein
MVEAELKRPIPEIFLEFSDQPIASGSIGQVYNATLLSGEPVVVKVKRPKIEKTILADLDLLELMAPFADRFEEWRPLRMPMVVEEFQKEMAAKGVAVTVHHIDDVRPQELPPADLYLFSSPGRMGRPIRGMRRFMKNVKLPAGTKYAVLTTEMAPQPD